MTHAKRTCLFIIIKIFQLFSRNEMKYKKWLDQRDNIFLGLIQRMTTKSTHSLWAVFIVWEHNSQRKFWRQDVSWGLRVVSLNHYIKHLMRTARCWLIHLILNRPLFIHRWDIFIYTMCSFWFLFLFYIWKKID